MKQHVMGTHATAEPPPLTHARIPDLGSTIEGRYQLVRLLASGSLGLLYEALDMRTGLDAVLKLLPPWAQRPAARERFLREAKMTTAIEHPHAVRCWGAGLIHGQIPYMAMERLRGVTLRERLRLVGLLPVRPALRILCQVLAALEAAHALRIVHRDVKPSNVFLDGRGAVLFDFGLGLQSCAETRLTLDGVVLGTPGYMAPEQIAGEEIDHRTDLYCVSAMAYETLTGRRPVAHAESSVRKLFEAVQCERPCPPSGLQPTLDTDIDELLLRGLEKNPALRFSSARQMRLRGEAILRRLGS